MFALLLGAAGVAAGVALDRVVAAAVAGGPQGLRASVSVSVSVSASASRVRETSALAVSTALVFALLAHHVGPTPSLAVDSVLAAGLLALSAVDLECHRLPNGVVVPVTVLVTASMGVTAAVSGRWTGFAAAVGAAAATTATVATVWWWSSRRHRRHRPTVGAGPASGPASGLGFGDVRLAWLVGLDAGGAGSPSEALLLAALALVVACGSGGVVGLAVELVGRAWRVNPWGRFPFGPCLAGGALWSVLWGHGLLGAWGLGQH